MGYPASLLFGATIINTGSTNRAPIPVVLGMRAADPLHRGTVLLHISAANYSLLHISARFQPVSQSSSA